MSEPYELRVHSGARRALTERLLLAVASAVWEFCIGPLRDNPRRVGKPLERQLSGYYSARRGAYRVIYRIEDDARVIEVVHIDHRAGVYHRR